MKNIFSYLGSNNKASYIAMAIAVSKTFFRPIITLIDKKEKPEVKKYTAVKEGVTEGVAIPVYASLMFVNNFCKKPLEKFIKRKSPAIAPQKLKNAGIIMELVNICLAGGIVIPYISSKLTNPIVKKITTKKPPKISKTDINILSYIDNEILSDNPNINNESSKQSYLPSYNTDISYGGSRCLRL